MPGQGTGKPKSKGGKPAGKAPVVKTSVTQETPERITKLVLDLFTLADVDGGGSVQYTEFVKHHKLVLSLAAESLGMSEDVSESEMQKTFREADNDDNLRLDQEEFELYMAGIWHAIGLRKFESLCETILREESSRRSEIAAGFHRKFSDNLLTTATGAHYFKDTTKQDCLDLLKNKADPNVADRNGCSALLHMTGKIDADFARSMLKARADPAKHTKDLDSPIFRAAQMRQMDLIRLFLLKSTEMPAAVEASQPGELSKELVQKMPSDLTPSRVQQLCAQHADLNYKDDRGWTPLTMATFFNRKDNIEALLKSQQPMKGVKLRFDGWNGKGRTALHIAARKELPEIIKLLLSNSADADVQDVDGWTPLHHACFNGSGESMKELLAGGASLFVRGNGGLTPFNASKLPEKAGTFSDQEIKLIQPPPEIDFAKGIIPILKDETTSNFQKIEDLLSLPTVRQNFANLRLHDHFFDPARGPNKVRLERMWTLLVKPLISEVRKGEVGMPLLPDPRTPEEAKQYHMLEIDRRRHLQKKFLLHWLEETRGPRPCVTWVHENRKGYEEDLQSVVETELGNYRKELDALYERFQSEEDGEQLAAMPPQENFDKKSLTQLRMHPIPSWVEELETVEAFEQLRLVGAVQPGLEDDLAAAAFVEQLVLEPAFEDGKRFWKNVYRTWLIHYARMMDFEFQQRVRAVVAKFNQQHEAEGFQVSYRAARPKSYDAIKRKEWKLGLKSTAETYEGRTTAASVLDLIRGTVSVNSPRAVMLLLERFRKLDLVSDKLKLLEVRNGYSNAADTKRLQGYRCVETYMHFNGGTLVGASGRAGKSLQISLIAEVNIVLDDYLSVRKRRHLLFKLSQGNFDWHTEDDDPEEKEIKHAWIQRGYTLAEDETIEEQTAADRATA
mmetsp:Transcript_78758/g.138992  ORF Transcript_78758/g.138992 Transcript_78758/m.138992 type:complete len:902 (-) Transcript_78758:106-2811(-)